jgi:tetratricopeptide (TPR) repeat protein
LASAHDEAEQHDMALAQLEIANRTHNGDGAVLLAIGLVLEKLKRPVEAAEYYRDAIACETATVTARQRLAAVAVLTGELDEAIEQYEALLEIEPHEMAYRSALAHLYYRTERYRRAVDEFERVIALEPENWALIQDEAEALVADGQFGEAIGRLTTLIREQGPDAGLHVRLGDLYGRIGDDRAAMQNYLAATELEPTYLEATVKIGTQHIIQGRWEEAAEAFCRAVDLNDSLLSNYIGLGSAQAAMGQRAEAIGTFDLAAAVEPNSTILLTEMCKLQLRCAASEEFAHSFGCESETPGECDAFSESLLVQQIERHAESVRNEPNHADVRYRFGVLLRATGGLAQAAEQFAEAARINPGFAKAWLKLGMTQQEMGQVEDAIESFRRATAADEAEVEAHYRLGLLYTSRQQFELAIRHMEAAAAGDEAGGEDAGRIRAGLALSLQNMGLMDRAAATWRSLWKLHKARL